MLCSYVCQYIKKCNTLIRTRNMLFEEKKKKFKNTLCIDYCIVLLDFIITSYFRILRLWCFAAITPHTVATMFSVF